MSADSLDFLPNSKANTPYPIETSFFDVCPTHFFDQIYNIADGLISDGVEALESKLLEEVDESEHDLVRSCCEKVLGKYQAAYDANIDKFEMYAVSNIFQVPPEAYQEWCRRKTERGEGQAAAAAEVPQPPNDENSPTVTAASMSALDAQLQAARKQLREANRRQAALKTRAKELKACRQVLSADAQKVHDAVFAHVPEEAAGTAAPLGSGEELKATMQSLRQRGENLRRLVASAAALRDANTAAASSASSLGTEEAGGGSAAAQAAALKRGVAGGGGGDTAAVRRIHARVK